MVFGFVLIYILKYTLFWPLESPITRARMSQGRTGRYGSPVISWFPYTHCNYISRETPPRLPLPFTVYPLRNHISVDLLQALVWSDLLLIDLFTDTKERCN
jgi:hypothetical protein